MEAQEVVGASAMMQFWVGNLWILVAAAMVFLMHLGFAALEAGLTQSKNTINILFKNVSVLAIGILSYAALGWSLMYPGDEFAGAFFGFAGFGLSVPEGAMTPAYNANYSFWADFLFQAMFAATAATIVSGAIAERMKIESFLLFAVVLVGIAYPIVGMWKWGGGFLHTLDTPFYDFAGSTLVHSVGGWAALWAALFLGARQGKFENGESKLIPPHSLPLATIGVFLLWFGWFGFNGGSVLSAEPGAVARVLVITMLAASAGAMGAMFACRIVMGHFDLSMVLNGVLGGLVGITAGADVMGIGDSLIVGALAGAVVVVAVILFDRFRIDDPVGALSVHLVGGIWGTLAVGIFGSMASIPQFLSQLYGVLIIGLAVSAISILTLAAIRAQFGLRVESEVELSGLDLHEHGLTAYRGVSLHQEVYQQHKSVDPTLATT